MKEAYLTPVFSVGPSSAFLHLEALKHYRWGPLKTVKSPTKTNLKNSTKWTVNGTLGRMRAETRGRVSLLDLSWDRNCPVTQICCCSGLVWD